MKTLLLEALCGGGLILSSSVKAALMVELCYLLKLNTNAISDTVMSQYLIPGDVFKGQLGFGLLCNDPAQESLSQCGAQKHSPVQK